MNTTLVRFMPARWRKKVLHLFLTRLSGQYVEGAAESGQILRKLYPKHLYDPLRRSMAIELGGKEIAKILDAKNNSELRHIRSAVEAMYETREGVYTPVHDFWSFIEMVLHVKKKELPELITAENVHWSRKDLPLEDLEMNWMPFLEQNQYIFGKKPWKVAMLQEKFASSPELLQQAKDDQLQIVGKQQHKFKQDSEPISVINRKNGYEIVDGNGRLYHAILAKKADISCYVGTQRGDMPINYWVSSGSLKQICLEARGYADKDQESFEHVIHYLKSKLRHNSTALINYHLYLRNDFPELETYLSDILPERKNQ